MSEINFPKAVFFDWDGTLADTYNFLNDAHNHLLVTLGFEPLREGEYKKYFGMPRDILYPAIYRDRHEEAKALFEKYVFENSHKINPLDGAADVLRFFAARGAVMGIISNKKGSFIDREIEHFGWRDFFKIIIGAGEAAADKPSPAPLLLALEKLDLKAGPAVWYVGDTGNDLKCAQGAGCPAIFVRGHEDPAPLVEHYKPLIYSENCADLHEILVAIAAKSSKKEA